MFRRIAQQYQDSTVVVIGAGGIGVEIVRLATPTAGRLFVADHRAESLETLAGTSDPLKLHTRPLDVSDPQAVEAFADWVESHGGAPDFVFYSAGVLTIEPFLETTAESWRRSVDINLNGAFYVARSFGARMAARRKGSILLLGSIAGTRARSGSRVNPVYNATKAGLSALVNSAAMQLRSSGVRINCISPGPTATSMMAIQPPAVHSAVSQITLDARQNDPREVAELALFVAGHGRFTGEDVGLGGGAGLGG